MNDDPRDALAHNLFGEDDETSAVRQIRRYAWEENVIKRVFAGCGAKPRGWGMYVNQSRELIGVPKLCFQWFNSTFPSFPARLCGAPITYVGKKKNGDNGKTENVYAYQLSLVDLVKPVERNKLIKRVLHHLHKAEIDIVKQKYMFCFSIVKTRFCAHNLRRLGSDSWEGGDWQFQIATKSEDSWMFIEPLDSVCRGVPATDWLDT